jgi:hypothetical protein
MFMLLSEVPHLPAWTIPKIPAPVVGSSYFSSTLEVLDCLAIAVLCTVVVLGASSDSTGPMYCHSLGVFLHTMAHKYGTELLMTSFVTVEIMSVVYVGASWTAARLTDPLSHAPSSSSTSLSTSVSNAFSFRSPMRGVGSGVVCSVRDTESVVRASSSLPHLFPNLTLSSPDATAGGRGGAAGTLFQASSHGVLAGSNSSMCNTSSSGNENSGSSSSRSKPSAKRTVYYQSRTGGRTTSPSTSPSPVSTSATAADSDASYLERNEHTYGGVSYADLFRNPNSSGTNSVAVRSSSSNNYMAGSSSYLRPNSQMSTTASFSSSSSSTAAPLAYTSVLAMSVGSWGSSSGVCGSSGSSSIGGSSAGGQQNSGNGSGCVSERLFDDFDATSITADIIHETAAVFDDVNEEESDKNESYVESYMNDTTFVDVHDDGTSNMEECASVAPNWHEVESSPEGDFKLHSNIKLKPLGAKSAISSDICVNLCDGIASRYYDSPVSPAVTGAINKPKGTSIGEGLTADCKDANSQLEIKSGGKVLQNNNIGDRVKSKKGGGKKNGFGNAGNMETISSTQQLKEAVDPPQVRTLSGSASSSSTTTGSNVSVRPNGPKKSYSSGFAFRSNKLDLIR